MRALQFKLFFVVFFVAFLASNAAGQPSPGSRSRDRIPTDILLQIIRAEDERRWDDKLQSLLGHEDANVRKRAVLAAGRIGDEQAIPSLAQMLLEDRNGEVREMAAFGLGEIESPGGAYALVMTLNDPARPGRARAFEALGKIAAAMASAPGPSGTNAGTKPEDERLDIIRAAMLEALRFEDRRRANSDRLTILLGLTAVLRAKPEGTTVGAAIKPFLDYPDARIVADALNTLARLRLKDGNEDARRLLTKHNDPIVRANAARVLGPTEDRQAFDALLDRALHDLDERVRVSAIRALGSLKDARAAEPLLARGKLLAQKAPARVAPPPDINELLEIANVIGIVLKDAQPKDALQFLRDVRAAVDAKSPEVEIAMARLDPSFYVTEEMRFGVGSPASIAQGLIEIAKIKKNQPAVEQASRFLVSWMKEFLDCSGRPTNIKRDLPSTKRCFPPIAMSPMLQAYAAFAPDDLDLMLHQRLNDKDVIVRATAAELIGQRPANSKNTRALIQALPRALRDRDLNDAALAILDALGKQKTKEANEAIKTGLNSSDHLIRRKAVELLKTNGVGDFADRIGTVKTRNTVADYRRAIARIGRKATATVVTNKGSFTIEFLPADAPLTVDNFIQLARRRYFNGQTIPRVVPNFVVQAGDPRGDQNGGPGYQIRCEINEVPYERGAVGMALSGKDTGGSQWFVTHSPQPHLNGGYTVFGRVISGMDVVDRIARGDVIRRVIINER
jgi:cyclophilin family peptidyl-prolyl cis-trans isomerase/HEAT repeat protein